MTDSDQQDHPDQSSNGVQNTTKRDFYRMLPGDNSPGHFTLRGSGGEFDVRRRENGQLEIQGKARHIGDVSIIRQLRATLQRSESALTDSEGTQLDDAASK